MKTLNRISNLIILILIIPYWIIKYLLYKIKCFHIWGKWTTKSMIKSASLKRQQKYFTVERECELCGKKEIKYCKY